jgi:hypothetical protein
MATEKKSKRQFNNEQCKTVAERVKIELDLYPAASENYRTTPPATGNYRFAFVPVWGPNLEAVKEKVSALYHPEDAAAINAALEA